METSALNETPNRKPPQGGSGTAPSKEEIRKAIDAFSPHPLVMPMSMSQASGTGSVLDEIPTPEECDRRIAQHFREINLLRKLKRLRQAHEANGEPPSEVAE